MSEGITIRVDRTLCDGFGPCAKHAPQYFSLDDWGYASLVGDGRVPAADRDAVMRALLDCPAHAIIEMSGHGPSTERAPVSVQESGEPHVNTDDSEAISGFVR